MPLRYAYNLLLLAAAFWAWPLIGAGLLASAKRRANLLPRLGWMGPDWDKRSFSKGPVWFHALSVGEVISALPLVEGFGKTFARPAVFSTSTVTGQGLACQRLAGQGIPVFYYPFDIPPAVNRVTNAVAPAMVVIVETDLWPNFLAAMARRQVPVVLVNARLSDSAFSGFRRLGPWAADLFGILAHVGAQGEGDAALYRGLGVAADKITVIGNLKFDCTVEPPSGRDLDSLRGLLGLAPDHRVVLAGSTHAGEEQVVCEAFGMVRRHRPDLALVVVPRDPRRGSEVAALFQKAGYRARRLSEAARANAPSEVVVVDRIGLLGHLYGLADLAFVGGSLVPEGGHNPLEPAGLAKPVVFGPDMSDFKEIARALCDAGAAVRVKGAQSLADALIDLLADPGRAQAMGRAGAALVAANRGAVARTLAMLREVAGRHGLTEFDGSGKWIGRGRLKRLPKPLPP